MLSLPALLSFLSGAFFVYGLAVLSGYNGNALQAVLKLLSSWKGCALLILASLIIIHFAIFAYLVIRFARGLTLPLAAQRYCMTIVILAIGERLRLQVADGGTFLWFGAFSLPHVLCLFAIVWIDARTVVKRQAGCSPTGRLVTSVCATLVLGLGVATPPAGAADLPPTTVHAIDALVEQALADSRVPSASIVVVRDGEIVLAKAYGKARLPDIDASPSMRYKIASNSKQLTATAILLLAERHKLSLDDKVARFLPDLTSADKVTIRNLLTHTSGYQDFYAEDYLLPEMRKDTTPQHILDVWGRKPLDFAPGTRWQYSNTNYVIAGRIVEQISHMPLMTFLHQEIFDKLGMKSPVDIGDWGAEDPTGYTTYGLGPARVVAPEGRNWLWAAGELGMTASDLARLDISLMHGEILSPASTRALTTQMTLTDGTATGYALGLAVRQLANGHRRWSHTGGASGFHSMNALYPDDRAAITVLTNGEGGTARSIVNGIETLLFTPITDPDAATALIRARALFTSLQAGTIDRAAMTPALNDYFSGPVLTDFATSLGPLGEVEDVSQSSFEYRGGMAHRVFQIKAGGQTMTMDSYLMPDGKWEQCLIFAQ